MTVLKHIEHYIGRIDGGWTSKEVQDIGFQVAFVENSPVQDTKTFISLGLSDYVLESHDNKSFRIELIFSMYSEYDTETYGYLLMSVCKAIILRGTPILCGDVIPLAKGLAQEVGFEALFCIHQWLFEEGLDVYEGSSPPTIFVSVLPLYQREVDYIEENGWENFQALMEAKAPDLCAMDRDPML